MTATCLGHKESVKKLLMAIRTNLTKEALALLPRTARKTNGKKKNKKLAGNGRSSPDFRK